MANDIQREETPLSRLQALLRQLFRFDCADLDFGIYRVMNSNRALVQDFLDRELPRIVAEHVGPEFESSLAHEAFNRLYTFFKRYYADGDFVPLPRSGTRDKPYAVPYDGSEVYLHWANKDQYYIKSSEDFRAYRWRTAGPPRVDVVFAVRDAEVPQDNRKAQEKRYFVADPGAMTWDGQTLTVPFAFRPATDEERKTWEKPERVAPVLAEQARALQVPGVTIADFQRHLTRFYKKNTSDYFIHKDLGGFLRRELDYFIKHEVLETDRLLDHETTPATAQLALARAVKRVAERIIAFLAKLEDFQKALWLKKKFVTETNYCVTLDRVPEELYPEIAKNDKQREEWVRLFAIDQIQGDLAGQVAYSKPLTVEFLKANQHLVLDTRFFDQRFKDKLLGSFDDFDRRCEGVLVQSDNFQGFILLSMRYLGCVQCGYIDPPYNTGKDAFVYKDNYQHSSWLTMLADRLKAFVALLSNDGVLLTSIDDREVASLHKLLEDQPRLSPVATLVWNTEGHTDNQLDIKINHEYVVLASSNPETCKIGFVVDPNTRSESNVWKGFATNSITKNGSGNPPSEVLLPEGFPSAVETLDLLATDVPPEFFDEVKRKGFISRDITTKYGVEYPIRLNRMVVKEGRLLDPCRVYSGWANVNKLREFIASGHQPLKESDGTTVFYLSDRGVIYYRKDRPKARNIVSVLRNMGTTELMRSELERMGIAFRYPKPKKLLAYLIQIGSDENGLICDFFPGSGTTVQATIEINRSDNGNRKYLLIEMADHFDTVLKPRIQKVVYSEDWKDGKPVSRRGSSHMFKYLRLESYEDCLDALPPLGEARGQEPGLDFAMHYLGDVERTAGSTMLSVDKFQWPFEAAIRDFSGRGRESYRVDLPETFAYLIGLHVRTIKTFHDQDRRYMVYRGQAPTAGGKALQEALVIWRTTGNWTQADFERDRDFVSSKILEGAAPPAMAFANDRCLVEGVRSLDPEFARLMFDCQEAP